MATIPGARLGQARGRVVTFARGSVSLRVQPRGFLACAALIVAILVMMCVSIGTGTDEISPWRVVMALFGHGGFANVFIVRTLRLPRALVALMVGAALGVSGGIFQSVTRNPLGSPDVIGFTQGAATAAVLEIIVFGGSTFAVAGGAVVGGLVTAFVVSVLAYQRGLHAFRLVLIGVGIGMMLQAARTYLLANASLDTAEQAQTWLTGSLDGVGWEHVWPLAAVLVLLLPCVTVLASRLSVMELGDEMASALGVRVERSRLALIIVAVALTGVAIASVGPIAFVALAAPQLARRLTAASGPALFATALMGGLIVICGDYAAQRIMPVTPLPAGVVTGALGGLYLIWLLHHEWRRERRG